MEVTRLKEIINFHPNKPNFINFDKVRPTEGGDCFADILKADMEKKGQQ